MKAMSGRQVGIIVLIVIGVLLVVAVLGRIGMVGGWGMTGPHMMRGAWADGRWGVGWSMPFFGMVWLAVLVGVGYLLVSSGRRALAAPTVRTETSLDVLKRRLAGGEITRQEYDEIKQELS
jgi:putative membrane protein